MSRHRPKLERAWQRAMRFEHIEWIALVLVAGAACANLVSESEPHPPACPAGEESRNAVSSPRVRVEAKYPNAAKRLRKSGYVCMNFSVQRDGSVGDICVSDQDPGTLFDREAATALSQWKFAPTKKPYPNGVCIQFYAE
jgi:TonB family protein